MDMIQRKRESVIKLEIAAQELLANGCIQAATLESSIAYDLRQDITEYYSEIFGSMYDEERAAEQDKLAA